MNTPRKNIIDLRKFFLLPIIFGSVKGLTRYLYHSTGFCDIKKDMIYFGYSFATKT